MRLAGVQWKTVFLPKTRMAQLQASASRSRNSNSTIAVTDMPDDIEKRFSLVEKSAGEKFSFNKRRAEGRDKSGVPKKTLSVKTRKINPTNTISYLQILGTGLDTQDTSPSVLLFFDNQRFIFNAGEGLQRFCAEHKIKLSKIDHILLSRICSETAGGVPGLLLTLAGIGEEGMAVNIWGPSDLKYLVAAMKSFIPHASMVHAERFGPDSLPSASSLADPIDVLHTDVVRISAVPLRSFSFNGYVAKPRDVSVVYICELPEVAGKFDCEKAKALGLTPGPKYRELQLGKSVKSDCHDISVHPSDVMEPPTPGPIVFIVDCQTESHLQELLSAQSLNSYYADASSDLHENGKIVNCVVHLSPISITSSPHYQNWMKRFTSAQHIMARHEMKNEKFPVLKSSAAIQAQLHYLCPQFFPAHGFAPLHVRENETTGCAPLLHKSVLAENLLKFILRPHAQLGLDKSNIPTVIAPSQVIDDLVAEIPAIVHAAQSIRELCSDHQVSTTDPCMEDDVLPICLHDVRRDDLEIVFLGTGSSQPSKYRNVSSIYINLFSNGGLLLDCGEGTLGQLKRRYGIDGGDDAVRNLRCVWISHIHADHHTGLARILALRHDLVKGIIPHEPLLVVGPSQLKNFLDAYQVLEDLDMQFLDCWATTRESSPVGRLREVLGDAGLECLISFPVMHCPNSFGIILKAASRLNAAGDVIPGWKIVYSGDTRPCPELIEASRAATVLIHEATFEDGLVEEAMARNHSTTREAIEMGALADAYRVILTHFSQRYPKIPVFDETLMPKTCVAFDLMSVNIADLHLLPKVLPYLKLLFRNQLQDPFDFDS